MPLSPTPFLRPSKRPNAASLVFLSGLALAAGTLLHAFEAKSFFPRSGPRGPALFTTLPAEQTGLRAHNAYSDPAMWDELSPQFLLGSLGTGVAIGDYDNDGLPDIFVVVKCGSGRLFRNLGGLKFADVTGPAGVEDPTSPWKHGAAFADINNDGWLDLFVCRFNAPNRLYLNQGNGTFREEAAARGLALVDASVMGAFADYDRDGWLDVYVQTSLLDNQLRPEGEPDRLFRNVEGTFVEVTDTSGMTGEARGHSATWWDYNEDGWPDLYVANDFKSPDRLYRNNQDGTFTDVLTTTVPHTPYFSMGSDIGDVNNDGHTDFLVGDMAATSRYQDHRGMARERARATAEQASEETPQYPRNALFLSTGSGIVLEGSFLSGLDATDWTWAVRFEDLDNDGRLDAYFTNGMVRELQNYDIFEKTMAQAASPAERTRLTKASHPFNEQHLAFRNLGDLQFEDASAEWGLDHVGIGFGAAFGDLDGDGDLDLVFSSFDAEVTLCRNDSDAGHAVVVSLRGIRSNRFGIGATVRIETDDGLQTRTLISARGYLSTSEPAVHFGLGAGTKINRLTVEWPSGASQAFENLSVDHHYIITEGEIAPAPSAVLPSPQFVENGTSLGLDFINHDLLLNELERQPLLPFRFNQPGPAAVIADFDGDHLDDLAIGGVTGEPGQFIANLGSGQFLPYGSSLFSEAAETADGPILALDADADGDIDILVTKAGVAAPANAAAYQPRLLLNDGRGRFSAAADLLPSLPLSVGAAAAADFERTGRLGIFMGGRIIPGDYPRAPRSALLAWRRDRYEDVTSLAPGLANRGMVTAALWLDIDDDGWSDLMVTYDWGTVACYRNVGGKRFEDVSEKLGFAATGNGWWRSMAAADFNHDGRPDLVVGNAGLNTAYQVSQEAPATLYANVVLGQSKPQLIEAMFAQDRWYPLRNRESLLQVFPSLVRRFTSGEAYARATFEEIFPAEVLAGATKFTAGELRSGVFLSQPDGTYRFSALPRWAQIAPINGLAAGDFDGDGHPDIVIAGNSYAPISETTRFDGGVGWFLRGGGRGGFDAMPPAQSGMIIRGDARALAVADINHDGWPDLFVTRSNAAALTFLNQGKPGRRSFGIVLQGQPGNSTAIGARVTVTLSDRSIQTAEVSAGSGYFAQSSATLFFGYPDSSPPTGVRVRWPDGRETESVLAEIPPPLLRLSAPE